MTANNPINMLYFITRLEEEIGNGAKVTLSVCEEDTLRVVVFWENYDFRFSYSAHANNIYGMTDESFIAFFAVYAKTKFRAMLSSL